MAYVPTGNATTLTVDMNRITSSTHRANGWWFNPSSGTSQLIGTFPASGSRTFTAPDGNDWVLVVDDAGAKLPAPGSADL